MPRGSGGSATSIGSVAITGTVDENIKQVNGVTVNVGTGAAGTGTLRVAVASDSSIILAAGTAVIGHVITDTTSTTAVTQDRNFCNSSYWMGRNCSWYSNKLWYYPNSSYCRECQRFNVCWYYCSYSNLKCS